MLPSPRLSALSGSLQSAPGCCSSPPRWPARSRSFSRFPSAHRASPPARSSPLASASLSVFASSVGRSLLSSSFLPLVLSFFLSCWFAPLLLIFFFFALNFIGSWISLSLCCPASLHRSFSPLVAGRKPIFWLFCVYFQFLSFRFGDISLPPSLFVLRTIALLFSLYDRTRFILIFVHLILQFEPLLSHSCSFIFSLFHVKVRGD